MGDQKMEILAQGELERVKAQWDSVKEKVLRTVIESIIGRPTTPEDGKRIVLYTYADYLQTGNSEVSFDGEKIGVLHEDWHNLKIEYFPKNHNGEKIDI